VKIMLLDETDPLDVLPPVELVVPLTPVEVAPPVPVPVPLVPDPALQAENAPNRATDPTSRSLARIPVEARSMGSMLSPRRVPGKTKPARRRRLSLDGGARPPLLLTAFNDP
jgi:hypothetical protein